MVCTFVFWDVKHGSAAYIQTPNGKHIVIDLGIGSYENSNDVFSPLWHLKNSGINRLDAVIITHPHTDHLDDIANFDLLSPKILIRPRHLTEKEIRDGNRTEDKEIIDQYLSIDSRYTSPVIDSDDICVSGNNGGVNIQLFTPKSCATSNLNNQSVVTVISYAGLKILIPGDNEPASWDELLGRNDFLSSVKNTDILVAPHHGRDSGFSADLLEYISPRLAIISDGRHCDTSATDRYGMKMRGWTVNKRNGEKENRKCVTTRNDGVIVVEFGTNTNGRNFIDVLID